MSSARAQANHKLYLAKILLANWQQAVAVQDIPVATLTQAFLPGVKEHLIGAYGWFLLELTGAEQLSGKPPRGCAGLPGIAAGKAVPPEMREFQQLEATGWLAALLAEQDLPALGGGRARGNLAVASVDMAGSEQAQQWAQLLEALFDRMSDSLDEY